MTNVLYPLVAGMLAAGYAVAALFFLRFWVRSRDRLFGMFSLAFALLGIQRLAGVIALQWTETTLWMYLLRLLAFLVILGAIVDKNRLRRRPGQPPSGARS